MSVPNGHNHRPQSVYTPRRHCTLDTMSICPLTVCCNQPPSSHNIYRLHHLPLLSYSLMLTYVNAVLVCLTSPSPDIYRHQSSSLLEVYSLRHRLSPSCPRTVPLSQRRFTESRPDSRHLPVDALMSSTKCCVII